ncbi:hypothetical protein M408DRAFT_25799 [Serendipita vermifera MAFF 305830]|uniref:Uncharacterized protein n=1 Tax=Serendipita vermifera MAFF 305830 TaxID=933852 RepID=A0A0C3AMU0_SERVB|nr:hypothetical protein M408DRAFT_25799 [Serendipita vermifera MAFF 305830]
MDDSQKLITPDAPRGNMKRTLLPATHALTGTSNKQSTGSRPLESVLKARILDVARIDTSLVALTEQQLDALDSDALENTTGGIALKILTQISTEERQDTFEDLSLNDQSAVRMLAALVFRWKLSKETDRFNTSAASTRLEVLNQLQQTTMAILKLAFPDEGTNDATTSSMVSSMMIQQYTLEILPATFSIGWLPPGQCKESPYIRSSTLRLLSSFGLGESIQLLGVTLNTPHLPTTAKNAIKYLLSRRILQPKGLQAFLGIMTGQESEATLAKYEQIAMLISTPPRGTSAEEYFRNVVPQILDILLAEDVASRTLQAAAYVFSDLVSSKHQDSTIFPILNVTLYAGFQEHTQERAKSYMPLETIKMMSKFAVAAPPSGDEPAIVKVLGPIIEKLYTLLYHLETKAISDPTETEACKGLLLSWLKLASAEVATERLWNVIEGKGGEWFIGGDNEELTLCWREQVVSQNLKLSDLSNLEKDVMSTNSLGLRPDPIHLVGLLKIVGRNEVASLLFVRLLGADYASDKVEPTRELLRMQLLYQMQQKLSSSILSNPSHALAFVDHAITTATAQKQSLQPSKSPLLVVANEGDEEDAQAGDILRTAVDFLLSSLEANPKYVPPKDDPHVQRVSEQLKSLTLHPSMALRQACREASLVLTARLSAAAVSGPGSEESSERLKNIREKYQEALVLLQDPLLPVRAQGLTMLRHLVELSAESKQDSGVDPALVPAILDIFINSAQNEDSFIFLNAVKGLVVMVQAFGRDVFRRLIDIYATESYVSGNMNRQELDMKLRIGEALAEVVGSCGQSLGGYVDILLPAILATIRDSSLPTTLRTSAISLASRCVETAPLAMSRYTAELSGAMVDILELEHTVAIEPRNRDERQETVGGVESKSDTEQEDEGGHNRRRRQRQGEAGDEATDANPVGVNPKLSPLRRSAIHLLGAILRGGGDYGLTGFPARRAGNVLRYLSVHDADNVVNAMAVEVVSLLGEVARARFHQ